MHTIIINETPADRVQQLINKLGALKNDCREMLKDASIPVEERWKLLLAFGGEWTTNCYVAEIAGLEAEDYFDLYYERHETIYVDHLLTRVLDKYEKDGKIIIKGKVDMPIENFVYVFKYDCVEKRISAFDLDW